MKKILILILFTLPLISKGQCVSVDSVYTTCDVKQIEDRNILFGVKQITEDILQDAGYSLCKGSSANVNISYLGIPENAFRIAGFAINTKITEIKVIVTIDGKEHVGLGQYKSTANAMMLELNDGVPFQQSTLSSALKISIADAIKH
jgi:hypothetical protein